MYKIQDWHSLPDGNPTLPELADFMEYSVLIDGHGFSLTSMQSVLGIGGDESLDPDIDDKNLLKLEEVLSLLDERRHDCGKHYPFICNEACALIDQGCIDAVKVIYLFLLLTTRVNMARYKIQQGLDGTELFEILCSYVLQNYFGNHSHRFLLGTSAGNDFRGKVESFIRELGIQGHSFRYPETGRHSEKDGKVDIIVFTPFSDTRYGSFVAFGQCKTGTTWRESINQINPKSFIDCYIAPPLTFTPISIYMVSESFYDNWERIQRCSSGIVFDRCRIMEYLPETIESSLLSDINVWNESILHQLNPCNIN